MNEMETELVGSDKYAARFGESIVNLGDIDNDGFEGNYKYPIWYLISALKMVHGREFDWSFMLFVFL